MYGSRGFATSSYGSIDNSNKACLYINDGIVVSENSTKSIAKTIFETLSITEVFNSIKLYFKLLTENIGITENMHKKVSKVCIESIHATDTLHKAISKILTEIISITETFTELIKHVAHSLYGRITKSSKYHSIKKTNLRGKIKKL